jgi:hypothetical protein
MNQLKKEFTILFQLSSVSRYSRDHLLKPESVLEHIGFCTVYGSLLAGRLKKAGIELDLGTLFTKIAMQTFALRSRKLNTARSRDWKSGSMQILWRVGLRRRSETRAQC